jgi:amphi-Trp domain-containing protein
MGRDEKFEYETVQTPKTLRDFILPILEGVEGGRLVLSAGGEQIELSPGGALDVEIRAKRKKEGGKLEIKVAWKGDGRLPRNGFAVTGA